MATFLINSSNLKQGGGVQVTQSLCGQFGRFKDTNFVIVLSNAIDIGGIDIDTNIEIVRYDMPVTIGSLLCGRCKYLDELVTNKGIDAVLTVFGPSRWKPRVPHLCGFARAQLLLKDSPYYQTLSLKERFKYILWKWLFKQSSYTFYTENEYISKMLPKAFGKVNVYTVTNYYNQVFDDENKWKRNINLPHFDGTTCLSISNHYPHKNFEIIPEIIKEIRSRHPGFKVRFVLSFDESEMPVEDDVRNDILFIGGVGVADCPYLYQQSEIMFMPTLMECFTATYPEAMRMGRPIVTTDLDFARGLCGESACYYSAVDARAAADAIYRVATDKQYYNHLVENGKMQLLLYDNYEVRAQKLVNILEEMI